jgi:photosystem II stability/assembly factor-like uncharacterized protein
MSKNMENDMKIKTSMLVMSTILATSLLTLGCQTKPYNVHSGDGDDRSQIPRVAFPEQKVADIDALKWRFIGPMMGNRGSAVIGHPTDKNVFFHAASNGLWKTTDAGKTWLAVGDKDFKKGSMGAIEISESNPDIIYVGTGEPQMRNNVTWGDGVYKSTDGGDTWTNMGLKDTHHIAQVRIHPSNPDIVYVAAYGHAFGPNEERGIFKSVDGGKTWDKVLYKGDKLGAIDLTMNHSNPDELFASMWEFERKAWGPKTGGGKSGLWHSTDGGKTWADISKNKGMPEGRFGRIGTSMAMNDDNTIYALIDSETKPGLYRSDNNGNSWAFVSDNFQIIGRPFYYSHIYVNPMNSEELWSPNNRLWSSTDGGKNWRVEEGIKDDFHDVWIDPTDANRMIATNDGGVQVTLTGGMSWSQNYAQKNAQYYRVSTDNQFPYNVYGTVQDLLSFKVPSSSRWGGISGYETTIIGNGETGNAFVDPDDNNIVFTISSGTTTGNGIAFTKNNIKTGQNEVRTVIPFPPYGVNTSELKYRVQWDTPFFISKYDSNTIFTAANVVFKSTDEGMSWTPISKDLTNDHEDKQVITGTPWLPEYFGQEIYSTIARMAESPVKRGIIWTGSDDGLIYLTKDEGKTWNNVTIPKLPKYSHIREIEASPYDAATAYATYSNYNTNDDYKPYLYKTTNYGKSWTNLSANFPQGETLRTVREDTQVKGLLYAGTETGVFVSLDDGKNWKSLSVNMPAVPVVDIEVKNNDLVIATNGRGLWVMDDITPIRANAKRNKNAVLLFDISDHTRLGYNWWLDYTPGGDPKGMKKYFVQNMRPNHVFYELGIVNGEKRREFVNAGDAKSLGVTMYFELMKEPKDISITILDAEGNEIRHYTKDDMRLKTVDAKDTSFNSGLNKFVWDMRYDAVEFMKLQPIAAPGNYKARLSVDGVDHVSKFKVFMSPNETYTKKQRAAKKKFWMALYESAKSNVAKIHKADAIAKEATAKAESNKALENSAKKVADVVSTYRTVYIAKGRTLAEIINQPSKIFSKMVWLHNLMESSEGPATQQSLDQFETLKKEMAAADAAYEKDIKPAMTAFEKASK